MEKHIIFSKVKKKMKFSQNNTRYSGWISFVLILHILHNIGCSIMPQVMPTYPGEQKIGKNLQNFGNFLENVAKTSQG
jgi:hypothetical protein